MTGNNVVVPSSITAKQQQDMEKRARKRTQLRMNDRERLRQNIHGERLVADLIRIGEDLQKKYKELSGNQVGALKAAADVKYKMLNKLLPDLKSVELEDKREGSDPRTLSTADLMALIERMSPGGIDEAEYVEVEPSQETPNW